MINKYLNERKEILQNNIKINNEKYEHNQISISEVYNKIKELETMVDEASEIFSVKAREDSGFNKQQIKEMETKIAYYESENSDLCEKTDILKKELEIVDSCLNQLSDYNVSRETLNVTKESDKIEKITNKENQNITNVDLLNRLIFCRDIAEVDGKRVFIELNEIISNISN